MGISTRTYQSQRGRSGQRVILESCPANDCEHEFGHGEKRDEHIETHGPEDFNMSSTTEQSESRSDK